MQWASHTPMRGVSLLSVNIEWLRAGKIAWSKDQIWGTQNYIVSDESKKHIGRL